MPDNDQSKPHVEERLDGIEQSLGVLEESIKERNPSVLGAIKTLVDDYNKFRTGERKAFPQAAVLGVVFAYLRPRVILTLAGLGAVALGGFQVWLLLNQSTLLEQQNDLIHTQNELFVTQNEYINSQKR